MADLDDFFAKRDKKKGKTKKYLSSDELVKQLEVNSLKEKEAKKPEKIEEETEASVEHDDEWKEFEEEKRPDLSNLKLKLGSLNVEDDDNNRENQDEYDENYTNDGENSDANPWKKANSTAAAPAPAPVPAPQKSTAAYVPTHLREGGAGTRMRSKKNAPDLQNTVNFPSLGAEVKPAVNANNIPKGFEEVKHGGKHMNSASGTAPVSIGNAYSTLNESLDS